MRRRQLQIELPQRPKEPCGNQDAGARGKNDPERHRSASSPSFAPCEAVRTPLAGIIRGSRRAP